MSRVISYIDGFNLYHGLRTTYRRRFLWLDLEKLCTSLLKPQQRLVQVNYFTAPVRRHPDSTRRQTLYENALTAQSRCLVIHRGRFQLQTVRCRACSASWRSYEEKETDVAIATSMVEDASRQAFDTALLVSADSDLCPAIRAVRRLHPAARLIAAFPPSRRSGEIQAVIDAWFTIGRGRLANALLPEDVKGPDGVVISRPPLWS